MKRNIDWEAVSSNLLDGCDKPAAILDRGLRFLLANREIEGLLGASRDDFLGRSFSEVCAPPDQAERVAELLDAIFGKLPRAWEETLFTADGRMLRVTLEARQIDQDGEPLLLVRILRWALVRASAPPGFDTDHHYEICALGADFGTIRSFWSTGERLEDPPIVGRRCFEVLYGRSKQCGSCPAERAFLDGSPLTVVLGGLRDKSSFRVMTAKPSSPDGVEVSVRELDASIVTPLIHARIEDLARQSGLSARERSVLELLLLGRSPDEIAKVLGIAPRTAKFHQTNLLAKLGADSRHDLLRLLV